MGMDFRTRLLQTLRAIEPVLRVPGVMIAGSVVPDLLEPDARSSLVVSQDIDVAVPVEAHGAVKAALGQVRDLAPSDDEPSVWVPLRPELLEVNFIGMDPGGPRAGETYVLEDPELPLLVFGHLSTLRPGPGLTIEGLVVPLPRPAGLLLEKLLTDRSGQKGDRDLLVALGLLLVCGEDDLRELEAQYRVLPPELRYATRSGLSTLSLLDPIAQMPDPTRERERIANLMMRLERAGGEA